MASPLFGSSGALSGRDGRITIDDTKVARVTQWDVNPTLATTSEWGDSDTAGYTARLPGRRDATFTCEGKFDTNQPIWDQFIVGAQVEAVLFLRDNNSDAYWKFLCAVCTDFSMVLDVDTEEVVGWSATFGADGRFYHPGEATGETYPS